MSDLLEIEIGPRGPVTGSVRVPASKSLTNRALALAALARGPSTIENPLFADDTARMVRALGSLGVGIRAVSEAGAVDVDELFASGWGSGPHSAALEVAGGGGRFGAHSAVLDAGGAGTTMRFVTALASLAMGEITVDGDPRMRQRPIGPLLEALSALGVEARSRLVPGFPPVTVRGGTLSGGDARIAGSVSSQFVSALLLVAPLAPNPSSIVVVPPIASRPYIDLTLGLMERFGVTVPRPRPGENGTGEKRSGPAAPLRFELPGGASYHAARYRVPADASSAAYFFAAAAATGGRVTVDGLDRDDPQPDTRVLAHLESMGCLVERVPQGTAVTGPRRGGLRPFDLDLGDAPDLVPTFAVLALRCGGACQIRNVPNLRIKESDRLRALATELARLGADVQERADGLRITPAPAGRSRGARIETYGDHRIAMAFAVAGLFTPGVRIADPRCVTKSFPGFWETLEIL